MRKIWFRAGECADEGKYMKNSLHADRKRAMCAVLLLILLLSAGGGTRISASVSNVVDVVDVVDVPKFGYSVLTKGYSAASESFLPFEYAGIEFVWRPAGADSPAVISLGAAVPVKGGWFADTAVSASADVVICRSAPGEHILADFFSLNSRYAPAAGIGGAASIRSFSGADDIWIQGELHPLRFETGGGYASVLAPVVLLNPYTFSRSDVFGNAENPSEPAEWLEWGFILFEYGFFVW